jgi:glycine cleavage system H protein
MSIPSELHYTSSHEWVRVDGDTAVVGITHHAQESLGDVVFVDLPEVGDTFEQGQEVAEIESVKAVSNIYAPVAGEVVEVNPAIDDAPETVNEDCYGAGWLLKIRMSDAGQVGGLLDAAAYGAEIDD